MRAAHSLKGAARIVDMTHAMHLAHAMEDVFVAAQKGQLSFTRDHIDVLLQGVDMFARIASKEEAENPSPSLVKEIDALIQSLKSILEGKEKASPPPPDTAPAPLQPTPQDSGKAVTTEERPDSRSLRVSAENMNRLMWLTGETVVASRRLPAIAGELLHLKFRHTALLKLLDALREALEESLSRELIQERLINVSRKAGSCYSLLLECLSAVEDHTYRTSELSQRLYNEVLSSRMMPFSEGIKGMPRMVRDLARELGKEIKLEVAGAETLVDRDILEKIEAPLNHLISNAIDHGVEPPEERLAAGKPAEATICIKAGHRAGMLNITISDDGRGIDTEAIRKTVVARKLAPEDIARDLTESELLEFLFLPNFTTKTTVTKISGRGVGLDVVRSIVQKLGGEVSASTQPGKGTQFELQVPLNLSVVRALLTEIAGELYAFPIAHIHKTLKIYQDLIEELEGRQYFSQGEERVALISADQVLGKTGEPVVDDELSIVVLSDRKRRYGLVVDRFLGIQELAVQPLDPRLGRVQDIAAAAILDDGSPVLIVDVNDMIQSMEILISKNRIERVEHSTSIGKEQGAKRILVVDDSITVRELERRLLSTKGYDVSVAVDGVDGWNALRTRHFDLVVTDVDMPRMDGIELVRTIKEDPRLNSLPVMIVSYKDREEDRNRGLEAGADYYLTKGSFHDETLVQAVEDLIGPP